MKAAGTTRLGNRLIKLASRMGSHLTAEIIQALSEQAVIVVGTKAASTILPRSAEQLTALLRQRAEIAVEVEELVDPPPSSTRPDEHARSRRQCRSTTPLRGLLLR